MLVFLDNQDSELAHVGPANRRSYRLYDAAKHGGAVAALYSFLHSTEMLKYISQVSSSICLSTQF